MSSLQTIPTFSSGSGRSASDLKSLGVFTVDPLRSEVLSGTTLEPKLYPMLLPGFFYIRDREFYYYGRKCTEILTAEIAPGFPSPVLALNERPFGMVPYIQYNGSNRDERLDDHASAPIIIHRHLKTNMPVNMVVNACIYYDTGYRKVKGYTLDTLGEVEAEASLVTNPYLTAVWPISPLVPYAKCYEYWRDDQTLLRPDTYIYHIDNNTIELLDAVDSDLYYYVIEYEGLNTSFYVNYDINPIAHMPHTSSCLVLRTDTVKAQADDTPSAITIITAPRYVARGETMSIQVAITSQHGNRIANTPVTFTLGYADITHGAARELLLDTAVYHTMRADDDTIPWNDYYELQLDTEPVQFAGRGWTGTARCNGTAFIPASGGFVDGVTRSSHITVITNEYGLAVATMTISDTTYFHGRCFIRVSIPGATADHVFAIDHRIAATRDVNGHINQGGTTVGPIDRQQWIGVMISSTDVEKLAYPITTIAPFINTDGKLSLVVPPSFMDPLAFRILAVADYANHLLGITPAVYQYPASILVNDREHGATTPMMTVIFDIPFSTDTWYLEYCPGPAHRGVPNAIHFRDPAGLPLHGRDTYRVEGL